MKARLLLVIALVAVVFATVVASASAVPMTRVYHATLVELNGSGVTGTAQFTQLANGNFKVRVWADGLVPFRVHSQHIRGFEDGSPAMVPPPDDGPYSDGIISLEEAAVYTGPSLLALKPYVRASGIGSQRFTQVYRGAELSRLNLEGVPLSSRVVMLQGGYLPAIYSYYGNLYDVNLPVAAGQIVGPFTQ